MSCFGGYLCLFININIQVLPNDMLDFLDAPVPYIVSILFAAISCNVSNRLLTRTSK